ncbi:S8 family peptidase [Streptomyces alkaliterrae]|uniref:S8 family serine peptidase n=1 Tax=Streptomyces alkaliterrae TaxID=2213162 RepID=A0A5P0YQX5_9ACTN|nr:S8 family serine peptidase [Streptomyces alkaliterrae]MBB1260954.1 S8 family serine peptidase [Streptomyces alkaliterrae]MQS02027.1 S8 family serine peptidase [Streptomyces alkaliterrae]
MAGANDAPRAPEAAKAPADNAQAAELPPQTRVERLIVGYKNKSEESGSNAAARKDIAAKARKAGEKLGFDRRLGTGAAVVDLGKELSRTEASEVMATFKADPDVAYVEPDTRMYAFATPNDTDYAKQWDLFEARAGMNVPEAWDTATGNGVTVAVIDTGYVSHSDLNGNTVAGYDFISDAGNARDGNGRDSDPSDTGDWRAAGECGPDTRASDSSWHGTHVAGTIGAIANNNKGVAGVAHRAKIQHVRVLGKCGGSTVDIADAITWASGGSVPGVPANPNPSKVLNLSLGGPGSCGTTTQNAINGAVGRGSTVVVAAGNSDQNASGFTPANCNNVITVAASNRNGDRARYSNYGATIDVTAPGGETHVSAANGILSTLNSGTRGPSTENYRAYQGTSMAAPHVAGLAALMLEAKPSLTPAQIESAIKANARPLPGTCSGGCGAGLADAAKTLRAVTGGGGDTGNPPAGRTFENTTRLNIPDTGRSVTSSINVTGVSGNGPSDLRVAVDIRHTYRGDLVVDLVAPNGNSVRLKNSSASDNVANLNQTYTVNASQVAANGTWRLRVTDVYRGDTGYLNAWSLTF